MSSVEKVTHIEDAQIDKKSSQNVLIVEDCMLLAIKGVQPTKTGVLSTCGGQQKLCLHFKAKFGPSFATQGWHILFYSRSTHKICSHCGHPSRSATCVLHKWPKKHNWQKVKFVLQSSETAKSQLAISISGCALFDAIGSIRTSVFRASKTPVGMPETFQFFASTKPSAILKSLSPPASTNKTVPKQS